jgi:hypothetical protein
MEDDTPGSLTGEDLFQEGKREKGRVFIKKDFYQI